MGTNHFAQQQANNYAAFCLLFEQLAWQLKCLRFVAAKALCSLALQHVDFTVDQCSWNVDVVRFHQTIDCLSLHAVTHGAFQLTLHVFTHFCTQTVDRTIFNAKAFDELFGEFWQLTLFNFLQHDFKLRCFPFQVFSVVIFREVDVDSEGFARFVANNTFFEAWDHTTLAHRQYEVRRFAAFELFTVYRTGEIDGCAVFSCRCCVGFFPGGLLLAQGVQHGVNVSISHFNNRFFNFDCVQTFQLNFRINFELCRESEVFADFVFARHILRCASRIDFFFDDRINKVALHQIAQNILANGSTVTLCHYAHRHFSFAETVDAHFLSYADQLTFHRVLDHIFINGNRYATAQALSCFY
ncbi:Uncharacterised protein [Klebsiella pneumoniae]|nr:Uncharacterised protein [Klebsiella pneumoniae]